METVTASQLKESPVEQILDVRLQDDYEAFHIPGAVSNCVFEVSFCDRLGDTAPNKDRTCVVYGANADSYEASMAVEKMERLGYSTVRVLEGGLAEWQTAGFEVEGHGNKSQSPAVPEGRLALDLGESRIEWIGRNLLNKHHGTVAMQSGFIEVKDNQLVGGHFVIDLNQIDCTDLEGDPKEGLIGHLKSDDFFDTERYPTAEFSILSSRQIENAKPGEQNLIVDAELTLKGKTAPVELAAAAGVTPEGKLAAQSSFLIDRTVWNVIYGSGKFFSRLGQHLVNDLVNIEIRVVTE